ncbi:MAG: dihydroneopterin triphosphate diphosphatase [Solirubrobacteraceae bacterium]|jgi:hypothetical protein|nr:dihydroneopterin triphosphate diphosphatase [Solirubrobacteraceae bacterium]
MRNGVLRRAPVAVLVLPYTVAIGGDVAYAVFRDRTTSDSPWHVIPGEAPRDQTPLQAAQRAAWCAARVPADALYLALDSRAMIPASGSACDIAQHAFAVRVMPEEVRSAHAQLEHRWLAYDIAGGLLHRIADRAALWELHHRFGRHTAFR